MKTRSAFSVGVLTSFSLALGSAALPSCGGGGGSHGSGGAGGGSAQAIFANAYPSGHPLAAGQAMFINETWGLEVLNSWPPADFMLSLMTSEPGVFGNQFTAFGFIADPNDQFPVGLKRGTTDPSKVYGTCVVCHSAHLDDGRNWLGAPNWRLQLGAFQLAVNQRWTKAGNPSLFSDAALKKLPLLGPGRIGAEPDDTHPLIADDIPVAFNLSQRTHLSKLGTGLDIKSEVYLSLFGFGAGYPDPQTAQVPFPDDASLAQFIAAFGSYDPPAGPAQDPTLVQQGKAVFSTASCDACHKVGDLAAEGVTTVDVAASGMDRLPGADPAYPRGSVHTDPLQVGLVTSGGGGADAGAGDGGDAGTGIDPGYAPYIKFIITHQLMISTSDGYRIPDLRGSWASQPYLHNGSVPTLEDLLKPSAQRPATWSLITGFTLDTSLLGNGDFGHEFGTTLSDSDKAALVAYLKSL